MVEVMAWAFSHGITMGLPYNNTVEYRRSSDEDEKEWGLLTSFVEHENVTLALRFASRTFSLHQSAMALTRNEHEETSATSATLCSSWI